MKHGPRANWECSKCGRIEDLPIDIQRCPYCSRKRGFVRLFDAVNVVGGKTRTLTKLLTKELEPVYTRHAATKASAQSFEKASAEAMEKTYEKATPAERAKMAPMIGHTLPAASVLGAIPSEARTDCRELITPALLQRKVVPQWQK